MLLIVHCVNGNLNADLWYPRYIDRNFNEVRLCDKVGILRRDIFPLFHVAIRFFEGLGNSNLFITDPRIVEGIDDVLKLNIRDDCRHDPLHECHLRNHAAPHLPSTDDTGTNDLALFLALCEFFVHIQHCRTPFTPPSVEISITIYI